MGVLVIRALLFLVYTRAPDLFETPFLRTLVPKTIPDMVFGTRKLEWGLSGPLEFLGLSDVFRWRAMWLLLDRASRVSQRVCWLAIERTPPFSKECQLNRRRCTKKAASKYVEFMSCGLSRRKVT